MNKTRIQSIALLFVAVAMALPMATPVRAQSARVDTMGFTASPGANFDKADYRLWLPRGTTPLEGVIVLVPGSNGDGRGEVMDSAWQAFATRRHLALVGVHLTDKPHAQNFIEEYINVSRGSGQTLLDALSSFATRSSHPEIANAPLLLWGMSAGGEFNYEFVSWKPERVIAFVVNKGGIYYTALAPKAARDVPGILFVGGKDLEFRTNTIVGLFAVNRRAGALWALAEEPGVAHVVGRSKDVAMVLYDEVLTLRRTGLSNSEPLRPLAERSGFVGDLKLKTFAAMGQSPAPTVPTSWLATERVARAWQAMVSEKPFDQ